MKIRLLISVLIVTGSWLAGRAETYVMDNKSRYDDSIGYEYDRIPTPEINSMASYYYSVK